jgi:hypothetical protein
MKELVKRMVSKRGSVLFIVLVIMSFMVILASAVFYTVSSGRQGVVMEYYDAQAFQTANDLLAVMEGNFLSGTDDLLSTAMFGGGGFDGLLIRCVTPVCDVELCNTCAMGIWFGNDTRTFAEMQAFIPPRFTQGLHFIRTSAPTVVPGGGSAEILIFVNFRGDIVVEITVEYNGRVVTSQRVYDRGEAERTFKPQWLNIQATPGSGLGWEWRANESGDIPRPGADWVKAEGLGHPLIGRGFVGVDVNAAGDTINAGWVRQVTRPFNLGGGMWLWTGTIQTPVSNKTMLDNDPEIRAVVGEDVVFFPVSHFVNNYEMSFPDFIKTSDYIGYIPEPCPCGVCSACDPPCLGGTCGVCPLCVWQSNQTTWDICGACREPWSVCPGDCVATCRRCGELWRDCWIRCTAACTWCVNCTNKCDPDEDDDDRVRLSDGSHLGGSLWHDDGSGRITVSAPGASWTQQAAFHITGHSAASPMSRVSVRGVNSTTYFHSDWTVFLAPDRPSYRSNITTRGNFVYTYANLFNQRDNPSENPLIIAVGGSMYVSTGANIIDSVSGTATPRLPAGAPRVNGQHGGFMTGHIHVYVHDNLHIGQNANNYASANTVWHIAGDLVFHEHPPTNGRFHVAGNIIDRNGATVNNPNANVTRRPVAERGAHAEEIRAFIINKMPTASENTTARWDAPPAGTGAGQSSTISRELRVRWGQSNRGGTVNPNSGFAQAQDHAFIDPDWNYTTAAGCRRWDCAVVNCSVAAHRNAWAFCSGSNCVDATHNNPLCARYGIRVTDRSKSNMYYIDRDATILNLSTKGGTRGDHGNIDGRFMILIDTGLVSDPTRVCNGVCDATPAERTARNCPCVNTARTIHIQLRGYLNNNTLFSWKPSTATAYSVSVLVLGDGNAVFYLPDAVEYRQGGVSDRNRLFFGPFNFAVGRDTRYDNWPLCPRNQRVNYLFDTSADCHPGCGSHLAGGGSRWGCWANGLLINDGSGRLRDNLLEYGSSLNSEGVRVWGLAGYNASQIAGLSESTRQTRADEQRIRGRNHMNPINLNIYLVHNAEGAGRFTFGPHSMFAGSVYAPRQSFAHVTQQGDRVKLFGSLYVGSSDIAGRDHFIAVLPGGGLGGGIPAVRDEHAVLIPPSTGTFEQPDPERGSPEFNNNQIIEGSAGNDTRGDADLPAPEIPNWRPV